LREGCGVVAPEEGVAEEDHAEVGVHVAGEPGASVQPAGDHVTRGGRVAEDDLRPRAEHHAHQAVQREQVGVDARHEPARVQEAAQELVEEEGNLLDQREDAAHETDEKNLGNVGQAQAYDDLVVGELPLILVEHHYRQGHHVERCQYDGQNQIGQPDTVPDHRVIADQ